MYTHSFQWFFDKWAGKDRRAAGDERSHAPVETSKYSANPPNLPIETLEGSSVLGFDGLQKLFSSLDDIWAWTLDSANKVGGSGSERLYKSHQERVFGDLEPIGSAPSLRTINGCGLALYGHADLDPRTDTYIATHYFVLVGIPIFPLARYRVSSSGNSYRFFGKLPLSYGNKIHVAVSVGLLLIALMSGAGGGGSSGGKYSGSNYGEGGTYNHGMTAPPSGSTNSTDGGSSSLGPGSEGKLDADASRSNSTDRSGPPDRHEGGINDGSGPTRADAKLALKTIIEARRQDINAMEAQINEMDTELRTMEEYLETEKLNLEEKERNNDIDEYNRTVDAYNATLRKYKVTLKKRNAAVDKYNDLIRLDKKDVAEYNSSVQLRP